MKANWKQVVMILSIILIVFSVVMPTWVPVFADGPCEPNPCPAEKPTCVPVDDNSYRCCNDEVGVCDPLPTLLDGGSTEGNPPRICELTSVIMSGFNMVIAVFPLAGLAILMFGAFLWATASVDPQKVERAKQTLTYGVIGLVVGLSAIAIVGTLEMILIGEDKFKWIEPGEGGGFLKVDFCLDEYATDGSDGGEGDDTEDEVDPNTCDFPCRKNTYCYEGTCISDLRDHPSNCIIMCSEKEYCYEGTCIPDPCYFDPCFSFDVSEEYTKCIVGADGNALCVHP